MATFPGKGSDDAVEQAEGGRKQDAIYCGFLCNFRNQFFPMNFWRKQNIQRAHVPLVVKHESGIILSHSETSRHSESATVHDLFVFSFCFQEMLRH